MAGRFLVYVVQLDDGEQITLSPEEFARKYGWKNKPERVRVFPKAEGGTGKAEQPVARIEPPKPKAGSGEPEPPRAVAPFDAEQAKKHQQAWASHLAIV